MSDHENYALIRWAMLNEGDRIKAESNEDFRASMNRGVGGANHHAKGRRENRVKCLHAWYAWFLATGEGMIGERVHQEILRLREVKSRESEI